MSEMESGAEQISPRNMSESGKGLMSRLFLRKWSVIASVLSTGISDIWEEYIFIRILRVLRALATGAR